VFSLPFKGPPVPATKAGMEFKFKLSGDGCRAAATPNCRPTFGQINVVFITDKLSGRNSQDNVPQGNTTDKYVQIYY